MISYDQPFNYSAINNLAVRKRTWRYDLFANNDTGGNCIDVWLDEMVSIHYAPAWCVVGAKLYYGNGLIQHAGDAVRPLVVVHPDYFS
ncbi:hypothetical protein O5282_18035 [Escherichia coli]|nr:hypothetical protein [Escherichia coli]